MQYLSKVRFHYAYHRGSLFIAILVLLLQGCGPSPELQTWHTEILDEEFSESMLGETVTDFEQYLALEQRLFDQLRREIYIDHRSGPAHSLERYNRGSLSDPSGREPNWNRTFELTVDDPKGAVLLLHGMSDSPYSLRALGEAHAVEHGYQVLGLRLPGHGTAPSGLTSASAGRT